VYDFHNFSVDQAQSVTEEFIKRTLHGSTKLTFE